MSTFLLFTLKILLLPTVYCALRQREVNEIIPTRAEQSSTLYNNEEKYGAHRAIDLDLNTHSDTARSDSRWFKLTLDRVFCVDKVKYLLSNSKYDTTWTCTNTGCSSCEGWFCRCYTVTVTTSEGASSEDVIPASDCKYGDSVILQHIVVNRYVWVYEIAVIGKQAEIEAQESSEDNTGVRSTLA